MEKKIGLIISLIGLGLSYFVWWISNADNKKIAPSNKAIDSIGGANPNEKTELIGDISEYKTQ
jgi:hypothetical protein